MKGHWDMPERTLNVPLWVMVNLTDFNVMVQEGVSNHSAAHSPWPGTYQKQGRLNHSLTLLLLPGVPITKVPKDQDRSGLTASAAYPPDPA